MTERILPGIGLTGYWDQGAAWKVGGDQNWLKSSVLTQLAVESATTSLPASPLNGVIYIVPVGDANANQIAARDNGAWVYMPPQEGWTAYVRDTGVLMNFNGAAWVPSTEPLAAALGAADGAGAVGAFVASAGMKPGFLSDLIYKFIFTSTVNPTGAAVVSAMAYCKANNSILINDSPVTIDISDAPTYTNAWGTYMAACPQIQGAGGSISLTGGRFGLDVTAEVINIRNLQISGQGWEATNLTDALINGAIYGSGATTANYENISLDNTVTDLTGKYRASRAVIDSGSERVQASHLQALNAVSAALFLDNDTVITNNVKGVNVGTGLHVARATTVIATNTTLLNVREQAANWPGKDKVVSPVGFNGLDAILCEECVNVTLRGYSSTWASERGAYLQGTASVFVEGGIAINSDGNKIVGWDRDNPLETGICSDVHVLLTSEFESADIRSTPSLVTTYFSDDMKIGGGSGARSESATVAVRALVTYGGFPYTGKSISVDASCYGDGVQTGAYGVLMSETAAQLAIIDPLQTFVIAERVEMLAGVLSFTGGNQSGALNSMRDAEASADAKAAATGAVTVMRFSGTQLNLTTNAPANRPNWIVDPRYVLTIYAANVSTDGFYRTVGPNLAAVQAKLQFSGITIASASTITAQLAALDTVTFAAGASFTLVQQPTSGATAHASMLMRADGFLKSQLIDVNISGPGYWQLGAAAVGVINYRSAAAYIANLNGAAAPVVVVGTINITMTAGAANLELRGDLAPAVKYSAQLSISLP
jgi:hypothetical protein